MLQYNMKIFGTQNIYFRPLIHSYDTNWHPILLYHNLFYFVLNYVTIQYENIWHPKYLF